MDVIASRLSLGVLTSEARAYDSLLGLRATFDLAPIGLAQFDVEGRFLLVNDRLCEILGYTRADVLARTFHEITFPDDLPHCLELTAKLVANEIPNYNIEKRFVRSDGSAVWTRVTVSDVRRSDGTVAFFIGAVEDMTEQVKAAQTLRIAEERLHTALGASMIGTFRFDVRRNALEWADGFDRVFGSSQNLTLEQFFEVIHPDDREQVMASYRRSVAEGTDFEEEFRVIWPDGTTHWLHDRGRTIRGADGIPHYIVGGITDISNHKRMEQVISEREAQFRTLANTIPQMAWIADSDGRRTWFNDRWFDYSGYSPEEMHGFGWMRVHHPDAADATLLNQQAAFRAGSIWEDTIRLRRKDGEYRWFLSRAMPVRALDGRITQWFGTNTDITDRLESELQLREREVRYRRALDVETIGVIFFDNEHNVTGMNNAFERMSGYSHAEVTEGEVLWQNLAPTDGGAPVDLRAAAFDATGRTPPSEVEFTRKDGTRFWGLMTATRVSETEEVKFVLDITAQKNAEQAREDLLRHEQAARTEAERAIAVRQQVLGFVAHDLRNPLQAMMAASALLEMPASTEQRARPINVIKRSAKAMDRLIADLLDVSRIEAGTFAVRREPVAISHVISEVVEGFQEQARAREVQLESSVAPGLPHLEADGGRLAQALSNLVNNALKFTPAGGRVLLDARQGAAHLDITVEDTGRGIAPENLSSIFDRFWQLDRTVGGAGLGLAIVKGIIESHDGQIHVESAPGRGTSFHLRLPCGAGAAV